MTVTHRADELIKTLSIRVNDGNESFVFGMKFDTPVSTIKIVEKDLLSFLNGHFNLKDGETNVQRK